MNFKNTLIGTISFIGVSFLVQGLSHFSVNSAHYASIPFMREEPLMFLGLTTMLIQGIVLSTLYIQWARMKPNGKWAGIPFSLLMGTFLVTYIALVEEDKYEVPNISQWILVESAAGLVQFGLFGILLSKFVTSTK